MYKLSGHGLEKGAWFVPETQSMTVQERESVSTVTLGPDAPEIGFGEWLLDDDWPEGPYVWRVKGLGDDANADTRTIELEHVIRTLDDITLDEVMTEDIGGSGATSCTAKAAVEYILAQHGSWVLGDFAFNVSNPYEFDGETLLDALETVTDTLDGAVWEYDLSVYPFRLHVRQRDTAARCEMRGGRNLSTFRRSVSRSGMYTRIYPTGKNGLTVTGGYLSRNEGLYGRVDHRETDQSRSTEESLRAWAQGRLNRHCEPAVTVQVSGLEMSAETGEALDALAINKLCRVPLPKYRTVITERIVKKQWRDRRKEPENVSITMANNLRDISSIVKEQARNGSSGRAGAGQARQNYLFVANGENLMYEVFDENGHVHGLLRMTEESLRVAFENLDASTRSEFLLTSESLRIQFENEISSTRSLFEMTSESLRIQFENDTSSLRSAISAEAGRIGLVVEGYGESAAVRRASIILAINGEGGSEAHIDADEVYIGNEKSTTVIGGKCALGDVTADYIAGKIATIATLNGIAASFVGNISTTSGVIAYQVYADGHNISDPVMDMQITGPVNNVYTLQAKKATDNTWQDIGNFSRATSLSGAWGSGGDADKFVVSASPQGNEYKYAPPLRLNGTTAASNFSAEITDSTGATTVAKKSVYGYLVKGGSGTGSYVDVNTKNDGTGTSVARISVGALYTSGYSDGNSAGQLTGWSEAYGKVSWPGSNTGSASMTVKAPAATKASSPNQQSVTYTLSSDNNVAYIKQGAVVVAQLTHNKYSTGYTYGKIDGMAAVAIQSVSRSGATVTATATNGATGTLGLTSHNNCKAGVTGVKVSGNWLHDVLYYKDGNTYKNVTSSAKYWYYSNTYGDPTTYYD